MKKKRSLFGFMELLQVLLIVLKLIGVIDWSWPVVLGYVLFVLVLFVFAIGWVGLKEFYYYCLRYYDDDMRSLDK